MSEARKLYSMANPYRIDVVQKPGGVSMTRQEFADECDINVLMARYERAGVWPLPPEGVQPKYLDLSDVPDFQSAMQLMIDANEAFMRLPAQVRREFDNDPGAFVAFAEKPDNIERMREWGLAPPAPVASKDSKPGEGGVSPDRTPPPPSDKSGGNTTQ